VHTTISTIEAILRRDETDLAGMMRVLTIPGHSATFDQWPSWVPRDIIDALPEIEKPYAHQVRAAELAWAGEHVVLATGTASGKSLGYLLPGLSHVLGDHAATPTGGSSVLYIAPTKALAHDQLRQINALGLNNVRAAVFDGDTPSEERAWIRAHANVVLTNPDMLHHGIIPNFRSWSSFLRRLALIAIDESHVYRGVFGAHISLVLRRLRRVCAEMRAHPTFVLCSATSAVPAAHASQLIGDSVVAIRDDTSPASERTLLFWQPDHLGQVRSAIAQTADLVANLVVDGVQTLAFVRSRKGAEAIASSAQDHVAIIDRDLATRIAAYRGGFLADERRDIESRFRSGDLMALATTNALELGIDIAGIDAVIVAGWPGTRAALWQQWGRAGRAGRAAVGIFVARDDPLDGYVVNHAEAIVAAPVEASVFDPTNPYVLDSHLAAAAAEIPLDDESAVRWFGGSAPERLTALGRVGLLRQRPTGWYWTARSRATDLADLRGTGGAPVSIVERPTGRLLGTVDAASAHGMVHEGALYLHQGEQFLVEEFDVAGSVALVVPVDVDYTTRARDVTDITIDMVDQSKALSGGMIHLGVVQVHSQVVGYQRRRILTGEVVGDFPLDLPVRTLRTVANWWTIDASSIERLTDCDLAGAAHAAEHAAIGLLPLFAVCDRWDIGGVSMVEHPDTGQLTVFVYDGYPGGAGFADRGYHVADEWLRATRDLVASCACPDGCPSCIQSPKCGNGNNPLDKIGAVQLLNELLGV
jgi:DEAD/DEAH box helicase domain-containing protein